MHQVISRYIDELKRARKPFITSDTQILSGRVPLTVSPGVQSDAVTSIRLDMPEDVKLDEAAYWLLFFVALFGAEKFAEIQPRIKKAMHTAGSFEEKIDGWILKLFWENNCRILLAEHESKKES